MTPALPRVSGAEVVRALLHAGFERTSQKGSHAKLKHPDGRIAVVPMHHELAAGTLHSILVAAKLKPADLIALLKR